MILAIEGCEDNLLPSDLNNKDKETSFSEEENIICLDKLDENNSKEEWERFFAQRGAKKIWQTLQQNRKENLSFDFIRLANYSTVIAQQSEVLTQGIIRYLADHQIPVKSMNLRYPSTIPLVDILANMNKLTKLNTLELSFNQPTEITPQIHDLTSLRQLKLLNNQFTEIPGELYSLTRLTTLDLSSNNITAISATISNLKNLQIFIISHNQLKQLPLEINQLISLHTFNLSSNQLEELPPQLGELANLAVLRLSYNQLKEIPSEIGKLNKLQSLDLNSNSITEIPAQFSELTDLWYLDLSQNNLTTISSQICKLAKLQSLNLSHNKLETLPKELSNLASLNSLNISYNQLKKLPLSTMPKLLSLESKLTLNNNPWLDNITYSKKQRVNKEELQIFAYKKNFPHSLITLCIYYIQTHQNLFVRHEVSQFKSARTS